MRYFFGFLITIGLIFLLIILLVRGGGGKPKVPITSKTLDSYATVDSLVRLTIDGPVNSEKTHDQVKITVDRDNVTYEHSKGYQGSTDKVKNYDNNVSSYTNFLLALAHAGFTNGIVKPDANLKDERGYCPLGNRYVYELVSDGKTIERFWATSCGKPKTYLGNLNLTNELFQVQVPDYNDLVQDIEL